MNDKIHHGIDWVVFIDSLDEISFDLIAEAVRERQMDEADTLAQSLVLSFTEVQTARKNPIEAIKMVNHRLRCGILVARIAVELIGEADAEEAAAFEGDDHWPEGSVTPPGEAADDFQETVIGLPHPSID